MMTLDHIQRLQFDDKPAAEALLLSFLREALALDVRSVMLRPLAVSLNSFNGFLTLSDGRELFFKTHTEPDGVLSEYYQAEQLAQAGYPVLQPVFQSTQAGQQLLVYEVVREPSVFDVAWAIENGDATHAQSLARAQQATDARLAEIYADTLAVQTSEQAASAPVHQLFSHRLTAGRLTRFYGETGAEIEIALPDGERVMMADVLRACWTVNGQQYAQTLAEMIERAKRVLAPAQGGPAIIGHGDAHNGNVFFRGADQLLLYFDPAFAGRHHPLMDLVKPLFHNVFAMWMYFPREKHAALSLSLRRDGSAWHVEHDYTLPPIREMFLESKLQHVLMPTLVSLRQRGLLRPDWREYLKAALMCCPLLTMNLADQQRFPPAISLLGLVMAVEMGAESQGVRSRVDSALDRASQSL